jgi:hypothetical protein
MTAASGSRHAKIGACAHRLPFAWGAGVKLSVAVVTVVGMTRRTKDQQVTALVEGLALGTLGIGITAVSSAKLEENEMTATYTFDVFSSLDGYGAASANWTGYWGKQGPELLDHRLALYGAEQRMVFRANTYRAFARMLASSAEESEVRDPWVTRMRSLPATVVSTTLEGPLNPDPPTRFRQSVSDVS